MAVVCMEQETLQKVHYFMRFWQSLDAFVKVPQKYVACIFIVPALIFIQGCQVTYTALVIHCQI